MAICSTEELGFYSKHTCSDRVVKRVYQLDMARAKIVGNIVHYRADNDVLYQFSVTDSTLLEEFQRAIDAGATIELEF